MDPEIEQAEKTLIISLLTNAKVIIPAIVSFTVVGIGSCTYWVQSKAPSEPATAGDPCCAVQKAAQGSGTVTTNNLAKVVWMGCTLSACKPLPTPAPIPVQDAGPSPVVVQYPTCPQGLMATHYTADQVNEWRKTLKAILPIRPKQLLNVPITTPTNLSKSFFRSLLRWALDQGNIGSCTGNAMIGCVTTIPFTFTFLTETNALDTYELATKKDSFKGTYPPTDTGSDGKSACAALVELGYAKSCFTTHFSLGQAAEQLVNQPITWGIPWHSNSYQLTNCGELNITGDIDGGHQTALVGVDPLYVNGQLDTNNSWIWGLNSWGNGWGLCIGEHCGYYRVRWSNAQILVNQGAAFDGPNVQ